MHAELGANEAVRLGHEGLALYEAAQWQSALERFELANQATFSPVFVLYMARCRRNIGQLVESMRLLDELLRHDLEPHAPTSWINAFRDARAERGSLRGRIPSLRITGGNLARVVIDGRSAPLDQLIELDPGAYMIRGWTKAGQLILRRVSLSEGQQDTVVRLSIAPPAPAPRVIRAAREDADASPALRYRQAAWASGGAGVVATLVGIVSGVIAYDKTKAVRDHCDGTLCPRDQAKAAENASDVANVSTTAFGIAGVNLAIGVTFFLLSRSP